MGVASRRAVLRLVRSAAKEGGQKVRVSCILPKLVLALSLSVHFHTRLTLLVVAGAQLIHRVQCNIVHRRFVRQFNTYRGHRDW